MATFEPTDQDVDTFLSMVPDLNRSQVVKRLKNNNNNVDQAVNEYFDNFNAPNKYDWDESAFSADRDGLLETHGLEFNIQSPDETGAFREQFSGGPSRPPSRISNNKFTRADAPPALTYDDADRDLHEALAASRAEAGLPPQETGVTLATATDQVAFGPANRTQYEPGKWDLVPTGEASQVQEILLDPEPAGRRRDIDTPAFLKPSVDDSRLGALMTIYHEIPLAREIFLDRKNISPNYGNNNEWWTGRNIELPTMNGPENPNRELGQEMQRLMAFLDKTDRSYGSADALANLAAIKKHYGVYGEDGEFAVFKAYREFLQDSDCVGAIKRLFSIGVDGPNSTDVEEFAILRLDLPAKDSDLTTLYDLADSALWHHEPQDLSNSPYLTHIGDVIAFQLAGDGRFSKGIEIPAVWYPDRYLDSGRQAALDMRIQKSEVKERLRLILAQEELLTNYNMPGKGPVKVQDLFQAVLGNEDQAKDDTSSAQEDDTAGRAPPSTSAKILSAEIRKVMKNIDRKLITLNDEKEKAKDALSKLSKLYTDPSANPTKPLHKYTLRGVSVSKDTMYVCTQAQPDLIDMNLDQDQSDSNGDQWWRISYAPTGSNPVTVEKTTEQKVLEAARDSTGGDKPSMLVYASEKAMSWDRNPLPTSLETFVRYDNALFRSEFPSEIASPLSSPGKRKFEPSAGDSPESSKWSASSTKAVDGDLDISHRDVRAAEYDHRAYSQGSERIEVLMGTDPFADGSQERPAPGPEMQERSHMPMLSSRPKASTPQTSTMDRSMDVERVVEDEHVATESGAVRHVGSGP